MDPDKGRIEPGAGIEDQIDGPTPAMLSQDIIADRDRQIKCRYSKRSAFTNNGAMKKRQVRCRKRHDAFRSNGVLLGAMAEQPISGCREHHPVQGPWDIKNCCSTAASGGGLHKWQI